MSSHYKLIRETPTKSGDIAVISHNGVLLPVDLKIMNRLNMCMEFDGDGIMTLRKIPNKRNPYLTKKGENNDYQQSQARCINR